MAKVAEWNYLGPRSTPHEVRQLRKASFDYHVNLGQPVIHKHKWNLKDVRDGRAQICPFHDVTLDENREYDPYCFGTGILGGWADGVITYVSIADTQEDRIRFGPEGVLLFETHPAFTAPWVPEMGDEDLLITAQFDLNTWDIIEEINRFELQEVTPKVFRGFAKNKAGYRVHQQGNMDKLPYGHRYYDVPIIFDYSNVPIPVIPPGGDPNDYPVTGGTLTSITREVRIGGKAGHFSEFTQPVAIEGLGTVASHSQSVHIGGDVSGTEFVWEEED